MERAREQPSSSERCQGHGSVQMHLQQHAHTLARPHSTKTSNERHQDFRMTLEVSDFKRGRLTVEVRAGVEEGESLRAQCPNPFQSKGFQVQVQADHFNSLMGLPLHCKRYTNHTNQFSSPKRPTSRRITSTVSWGCHSTASDMSIYESVVQVPVPSPEGSMQRAQP